MKEGSMKYRKLGSSDLEVSALSFGAWQLADTDYWGASDGSGADAVRAAIDSGITLFDTAEIYANGESEKALGHAIGTDRDKVLIATKLGESNCAPADARAACEGSLRRLGTDRIDLYQVHWPSRQVPFADTFDEMLKLKREGKVREVGLSNFGRKDLDEWMQTGSAVSNQLGYNLLFRAIEYEIVPACAEYGLGILVYMPLIQGILAGRWKTVEDIPVPRRRTRHFSPNREGTRHSDRGNEDITIDTLRELAKLADEIKEPLARVAIAWLLARPGIASVIVGGRKAEQVTRNMGAVDLELGAETIRRLDETTAPLKKDLGSNADFWLEAERSRIR